VTTASDRPMTGLGQSPSQGRSRDSEGGGDRLETVALAKHRDRRPEVQLDLGTTAVLAVRLCSADAGDHPLSDQLSFEFRDRTEDL